MFAKSLYFFAFGFMFLLGNANLSYAEMFVYPKEGQSKEKQEMDEYHCHKWAVEQTGVSPAGLAEQAAAPPAQYQTRQEGGLLRGAGRGAALGAVGGAIGGNAGKGAAIGAGVGALVGGMRRRQSEKKQMEAQQQAQRQATQYTHAQLQRYNKAKGVCLRGRGYSVE